jgi:hypothetical protein
MNGATSAAAFPLSENVVVMNIDCFYKEKKSYNLTTGYPVVNYAPDSMKQECSIGRNWFKALMLSPGVLFAAFYLVVWCSTNIYLDHTFRNNLTRSFSSVAGSRYQLKIGSLGTGPELNFLTLKQLELVPVPSGSSSPTGSIMIDKLDIACPDIGFLLIRPSWAEITMQMVSQKLLCRCLDQALSMDHEPRPAPAYRRNLVNRVGEDRKVRIP